MEKYKIPNSFARKEECLPGIAPLLPDAAAAAGVVLLDALVLGDGAADPVHRIAQELGHFTAAGGGR